MRRWTAILCGLIPPASLRAERFHHLLLSPGDLGVPPAAGAAIFFFPDEGAEERLAIPAGVLVKFPRGPGRIRVGAAWDSSGAVAVGSVQVEAE